jgi:hypothetical protein
MIISLGSSPKVIESIERYYGFKKEESLFDWSFSNFKAVLHFIKNIDSKINDEDFYDTKDEEHILGCRIVNHKKLRFCISREFPLIQSFKSYLPTFIDSINRRLRKLKNNIAENYIIDFIHSLDESENYNFKSNSAFRDANIYVPTNAMIHDFANHVKNINPNLNFILHLLVPPNYINDYNDLLSTLNHPNLKIHFMKQEVGNYVITGGSLCLNWHWENIYNNLNKDISFQISIPKDFNPVFYKKIYPDLAHLSDESAIHHYLHHGIKEGRLYKIDKEVKFDPIVYKRIYKDLAHMNDEEALIHYLIFGAKENRKFHYDEVLDPKRYKKLHLDLRDMTDREATLHFYEKGLKEGRAII